MKKVELLKELPSNLALEEAQQDAFDDEENFDLDFEFEALEPRVAFWGPSTPVAPIGSTPVAHP